MMRSLWFLLPVIMVISTAVFAADAEIGKKLVQDKGCVACHGATGESPTSQDYPELAGQATDYLVRALSDYKSGRRKNPIMAGMAANLTPDDIDNLAAWFSSQQQGLKVKY